MSDLIIPLFDFYMENKRDLVFSGAKIISLESSEISDKLRENINKHKKKHVLKYAIKIESRNLEKRRILNSVLSLFRLYKDSIINAFLIADHNGITDMLPHYVNIYLKSGEQRRKFYLKKSKEKDFTEYWNEFSNDLYPNFAVGRLNVADYYPHATDNLLSYVEALEFLLLPKDRGENTFKFSSRGCMILGRNKEASIKKDIYIFLKTVYAIRSSIVHGDKTNLKNKPWVYYLKKLRSYARDAIKYFYINKCLNNSKERKKLLEEKTIFKVEIE